MTIAVLEYMASDSDRSRGLCCLITIGLGELCCLITIGLGDVYDLALLWMLPLNGCAQKPPEMNFFQFREV